MTAVPTFDDWLELLGLDSVMTTLLAGTISADAAEETIRAEWESYPDVSQDYVAILEQAVYAVAAVRLSIDSQQDAVAKFNEASNEFNEAANEIELRFDYEPGRLMTSDEEVEFERLGEELRTRIERAEQEREAEQLQEELQAEADDGQEVMENSVDECLGEYEEALSDYEDAVQDLKRLLEKKRKEKEKAASTPKTEAKK